MLYDLPSDAPSSRLTMAAPAVPELVLAAGGTQKAPIIHGAIHAALCHVLITDEGSANALLSARWRPGRGPH